MVILASNGGFLLASAEVFQLTPKEAESLRYHFGTSNRGGRRYLPYVFTEQGVAMLSSVLQSKQAAHVNIAIMRAFVKLREVIVTHKDLALRINELEKKYEEHDNTIKEVFEAIRMMMAPQPPHRQIGFRIEARA